MNVIMAHVVHHMNRKEVVVNDGHWSLVSEISYQNLNDKEGVPYVRVSVTLCTTAGKR